MGLSLPLLRSITRYLGKESWKVIFTSKRCLVLAEEDPFIWTNVWSEDKSKCCYQIAAEIGNMRWIKHLRFYGQANNFDEGYLVLKGNLDIIKYLYYAKQLYDLPELLHVAIIRGQHEIVRWLHYMEAKLSDKFTEYGVVPTRYSKMFSTRHLDLQLTKWLDRNVNGEWNLNDPFSIVVLLDHGNRSILRYLDYRIGLNLGPNISSITWSLHSLEESKWIMNHFPGNQLELDIRSSIPEQRLDVRKWVNYKFNCIGNPLIPFASLGLIELVKWECKNGGCLHYIDIAIGFAKSKEKLLPVQQYLENLKHLSDDS